MPERTEKRFDSRKIAVQALCLAVPALLLIANLNAGSDELADAAWMTLGATTCLLTVIGLRAHETLPVSMLVLPVLLGAFVIAGLAGNWYEARTEVLQLIAAMAIWSTGLLLAQSRRFLGACWMGLLAAIALFGLIALISYPANAFGPSPGVGPDEVYRLSFTLGSPNVFASLMGMTVILCIVHLMYLMRTRVAPDIPWLAKLSHMPRSGYVSAISLLICSGCLILSLSRAGIALTIAVLAIGFGVEFGRRLWKGGGLLRRLTATLALGLGSILLAGIGLSGGQIGSRAGALGTDGNARWQMYSEYWAAWLENPLFGYGLGSFNRVNETITTMENASHLVTIGAAHNVVLQWLLQTGLAGFALIAGVMVWMHWRIALSAMRLSDNSRHYFGVAVLLVSAFLLLHNQVDFSLEIPGVMWTYAFLLGLGCGTPAKQRSRG